MLCPNCHTEVPDGTPGCPNCGAPLLSAQPSPRAGQKRSSAPLVIGIIAVVFLMLGCLSVGGVLAVRALLGSDEQPESTPAASTAADEGDVSISAAAGHESAEAAMIARLAEEGLSDWVFDVSEEGDGYVVYIAGPPASEYASQYRVEQGSDGWAVTESTALGFENIEAGSAAEAEQVVMDFLTCVSEDRGLDAQALTVDPFRSDSASAQVSAGGLAQYAVVGSLGDPDGSYWIQTTQDWYGASENWEYWVVPTEAGYRIADVQPW